MADIVARGDNFAIDSVEIESLKAFFSERGFEANDSEHVRSAVKMRVFYQEALDTGLVSKIPESSGPYQYHTVQTQFLVYQRYVANLLQNYPVSDDAIRSYYLSYPEQFRINATDKKDESSPDMVPLDNNIRRQIHKKIVDSKKVLVIEEEFERLLAKYHVVMEQ